MRSPSAESAGASTAEPVRQRIVGDESAQNADQVSAGDPPQAVLGLIQDEGTGGRPQAREEQGLSDNSRRHARHRHERADMRQIAKGLASHANPLQRGKGDPLLCLHAAIRSVDELLAFFPAKFPQGRWNPAESGFQDCWFQAIDGIRLHGWYFPHDHPSAVILFIHGNGGNLSYRAPVVRFLHDRFAASVMIFDYPSSPEAVKPLLPALESLPESKRAVESYGRERWNKEKLAARLRQGIEWGVKNRLPLYCGEFGVFPVRSKPEHRANWFRDFGEVLAENHIGWAVWGWDEGFGLNRRMVNGKPVVDAVVTRSLGLKAGESSGLPSPSGRGLG
jgi:hypothetical protein